MRCETTATARGEMEMEIEDGSMVMFQLKNILMVLS